MKSGKSQRLSGLMRRPDRLGQGGRIGSTLVTRAMQDAARRLPDDGGGSADTPAERAHSRGAEAFELVAVAGSLLESSKELLQVSHAQVRRFMSQRVITADELMALTNRRISKAS